MPNKIFILLFVISLFLFSGTAIAQPELKEGLWEIITTIEEPGMPKEMMKQTFKNCLTKKDYIPYKEEDKNCKVTSYNVKGNIVTWTIRCEDEEGISIGTGKVTYKGDTFEGFIKYKDPEGAMTMTIKGRWIGKCPK